MTGSTTSSQNCCFRFNPLRLWTLDEMQLELDQAKPLLQGHLVSCSIQDHIDDMTKYAPRSVIIFFPETFQFKRRLFVIEQGREALTADLKKYPDALIVRWYNSITGKMNGESVHGVYGTRSPDLHSWDRVALTAAACCLGEDPILFTCVRGLNAFYGAEEPLNNYYFRRVTLKREPEGKTLLHTYFLTNNEVVRDWNAVRVDSDSLAIRPQIIHSRQLHYHEIQTRLRGNDNGAAEDLEERSSNAVEHFVGIPRRCRVAKEDNMPADFTEVSKLELCTVGRHKTQRTRFKLSGDWYWVPKEHNEILGQHIGRGGVRVRWGSKGFECEIATGVSSSSSEGAMETPGSLDRHAPQSAGPRRFLGQPSACTDIPISEHPHPILGIGFKRHGARSKKVPPSYLVLELPEGPQRYWMPRSITTAFCEELKRGGKMPLEDVMFESEFDWPQGLYLLRTQAVKISVSGYPNPEPMICIVSSDHRPLITQPETKQSRNKRMIQLAPMDVTKRRRIKMED